MARLAALVPPSRRHLTGFHGVFAPPSKLCAAVTRARRLKRVFGIEIDHCAYSGSALKIVASIKDPQVIVKILSHLEHAAPQQSQPELLRGTWAPPVQSGLL